MPKQLGHNFQHDKKIAINHDPLGSESLNHIKVDQIKIQNTNLG